jgi:hypothetical protein
MLHSLDQVVDPLGRSVADVGPVAGRDLVMPANECAPERPCLDRIILCLGDRDRAGSPTRRRRRDRRARESLESLPSLPDGDDVLIRITGMLVPHELLPSTVVDAGAFASGKPISSSHLRLGSACIGLLLF